MAVIRPFRPYRYTDKAGPLSELIAPPYDVISPAEREALAAKREAGAIHVILPRGEEKYTAAADLLTDWRAKGLISREDEPAMFLSCQSFRAAGQEYERWGLLTTLQLERFEDDIVLPHERTLSGPKEDRLRLIRACRTNLSPIFCFVDAALDLAGRAEEAKLLADFEDDRGVQQRVWRLNDAGALRELTERVGREQVFIADGHHRYETALGYRDERRRAAETNGKQGAYNFVLAHICSTRDPGLAVLPTHRIPNQPPDAAILEARCRELGSVEEMPDGQALWAALAATSGERCPRLGVLLPPGRALLVEPGTPAREKLARLAPELAILDVTFLHDVILPEIPNDQFTYTHDEQETIDAVASGSAGLAILLPPPSVQDVLAISRASLTMPQKSTYFYPKVPSGIAYNPLD